MDQRITSIQIQKKNKNRVSLYLDGVFAIGISKFLTSSLRIGQLIAPSEIEKLIKEDETESATLRAVRYIQYKPRSEAQVYKKLVDQGTRIEIIPEVIARLQEIGLIDDLKFAHTWVENRIAFKPRGHYALTYELKNKGISSEIIDQVLVDVDESEMALKATMKFQDRYPDLTWNQFRSKLQGYLSRRGFSYDVISRVADHFRNQHPKTSEETQDYKS